MTNPKGTAHESHLVATADTERTHSPSDQKPDRSSQGIEKPSLYTLLGTDEEIHRMMSRELADILIRMKIPPFLIEDLVQEAWLSAVQHGELFVGADAKRLLRGFLRKAVHDKAVDLRRHLDLCPCQFLDGQKMEFSDEAEAQRAEMAEQHEWLEALLEDAGLGHEENKELLRAHFFQGVTISELAQRSGMSVDAVGSRIRRLVDKMREKVRKNFPQQVQGRL
jgi:RNA polymerase sigma factor (sigma-70 family)